MVSEKAIKEIVQERKQEIIDLLVESLQTPSVTGNEYEMGKVVEKWIHKIGLETKNYEAQKDRPNIIAEWFGSTPGPRFVFNGHMDVFPPVEGDMGTYGPWSGKVKDGYVYGRGAADMKGGLCASIMAVKLLKEIGFDPKGSVLISAVSDEEKGGIYGTKHLLEKGLLNGDFGICGEPSDGRVQVGGGGSIGAFITYTSETGHCFKPHPSIDALKKSITAINELYKLDQRLREHYFPLYDATTCLSVSSLHSGDASNTHPAMSRFSVDLRIFPGQSVEWAHKQIRDVLDDLKNKNPEFEYTYEIEREFPNFELDQDDENVNKIVSAARSVYGQVTGTPAEIYRTTGSADANTIVDDTGMAMICLGPGEHKEMNQPDEKISIEKYLNIVETYMGIIVRLLG